MHGTIHLFDRLPQVDPVAKARVRPQAAPVRAVPLVGLVRNPHSHGNAGAQALAEASPDVITALPERRSELPAILADFAERRIDYLAIDGGDGTVRDVLTCGAGAFGESWPEIILLPSGKTNALAYDLGIPADWTLADALEQARARNHAVRRPLVVAMRDNEAAQVRGFVMGAGAFTEAISLGQEAHSIGAFDAAVVGLTALWSAAQAFFGGSENKWRRGTRMRLRDADGREIEHAGGGSMHERYLMFASTLERFPAGLRPFCEAEGAVKLAVLDNSRRRLLARLPMIFRGHLGKATQRLGGHTHGLEGFTFDLADRFILDGEAFPAGSYAVNAGPKLRFVVP